MNILNVYFEDVEKDFVRYSPKSWITLSGLCPVFPLLKPKFSRVRGSRGKELSSTAFFSFFRRNSRAAVIYVFSVNKIDFRGWNCVVLETPMTSDAQGTYLLPEGVL